MSDLKPCAHCGSVYTQVRWIGFTHTHNGAFEAGYRGECVECGVTTRACHTEAEAIKAWNTRHEETCQNLSDDDDVFVCSECRNETRGFMVDDFGMTVGFGKVVSKCPNCGKRVMRYAN